jgi:hypothetical protein
MNQTPGQTTTIAVLKIVLKDAALVLALLLGLEVAVRVAAPQPLQKMLRYVYEPSKKYNGFQFIPGARVVCNNGYGDHLFAVNQWRCRDRDYGPKQPGEFRILCIGDSYSENQALEVQQIYSKVLESELKTKYPGRVFSVINAGMAGWRLWQFYDYLEDMLPVIKPDLVVVGVGASANAFKMNSKPEVPEMKIFSGLPVRADESLADRLHFGIWFTNQMLESYSQAYILFRELTYYPALWLKLSKVPAFHPLCLQRGRVVTENDPNGTVVCKINALCARYGARLALLNIPHYYECIPQETWLKIQLENPDVSKLDVQLPARFISNIARHLTIPLYDPSAALAASPEPVYFHGFFHWNERGNKIVADGLLQFLEKNKLLGPANQHEDTVPMP